jgi:hypothetical protein
MRTANAVRKIVLKCSSLKLRRLCRPCLRLLYLRRYAAYVAALPLPGVIGLTRWGKPWGRPGDRPYRDCAYPSTRWATETVGQAVWALWGSPLQGLRVSFDAAAQAMGAQKIAPLQRCRAFLSSLFSALCSQLSVSMSRWCGGRRG